MNAHSHQWHALLSPLLLVLVSYAKPFKNNRKALIVESHNSIEEFTLMHILSKSVVQSISLGVLTGSLNVRSTKSVTTPNWEDPPLISIISDHTVS